MENKRTRGNFNVMYRLVGLVRPLAPVMVCAVLLGVAGFLCAIFIPVLGVYALLDSLHFSVPVMLKIACILLPILAVARGVLHYAEQGCNHFIAFKLLAFIRDKVFGVLRQLAPAKLEGRDKGDLIAVLTADIELLEVFYAHTISPICIAVIVSVVMACFMGSYAPALGLYAALAYAVIGIGIPVAAARGARKSGESFRAEFGALNGFVLDSLRGVRESLQYNDGAHRLAQINQRTDALARQVRRLSTRSLRLRRFTSRARICRCRLSLPGGTAIMNTRSTGFPSGAPQSTPRRSSSAEMPGADTPALQAWGSAMPPPMAVVPPNVSR